MEIDNNITDNSKTHIRFGKDRKGNEITNELDNLLIGGHTGSGKSMFLNYLIHTFLRTFLPEELELILIDTKLAEFYVYEGIKHLRGKVYQDVNESIGALKECLSEIERRKREKVCGPFIIVLIDEFAPLVIQNPESEELICSIAQEGKEVGVFIILSSSKASKNVYTKKVLDTITKRLIGSITSQDGSLLLLGEKGAEELEGRGDMILKDTENNEKIRIQTPYISHEDIMNVIDKYLVSSHIDKKNPPPKVEEIEEISVSEEEIKQLQREYKNITIQIIQRKLRLPYKQAIAVYKRINRK